MLAKISFIVVSFVILSVAKAEITYPIVCKGGTGLTFTFISHAGNNPDTLVVNFTKAQNYPSTGVLKDGECSWKDRPLNSVEPAALCFKLTGNMSAVFSWKGSSAGGVANVLSGTTLTRASLGYIDADSNLTHPTERGFVPKFKSNTYYTLEVYNNRNGYLVF